MAKQSETSALGAATEAPRRHSCGVRSATMRAGRLYSRKWPALPQPRRAYVTMLVCRRVAEDGGVDRVAAGQRLRLCDEWPLGARGGGDADSEDAIGAVGAVLVRFRLRVRVGARPLRRFDRRPDGPALVGRGSTCHPYTRRPAPTACRSPTARLRVSGR